MVLPVVKPLHKSIMEEWINARGCERKTILESMLKLICLAHILINRMKAILVMSMMRGLKDVSYLMVAITTFSDVLGSLFQVTSWLKLGLSVHSVRDQGSG
jgi:hypothetical protein